MSGKTSGSDAKSRDHHDGSAGRAFTVEQKAAEKACNAWLADAKEAFQKGRAVSREIARLQWVVFKLTVFAPRGDVPVKERLVRVPLFVRQVFMSTVNRILNPMAMKLLARLEK